MNHGRKKYLAKCLVAATCLFFPLATIAMLLGIEPFHSTYYSFVWWTYIVFVQAFLYLKQGESALFTGTGGFFLLLPLSATVWLVFEAFNFRLSNWHYINIPANVFARWSGYAIAYSTVLPGIFSTYALLDFLGIFRNAKCAPLTAPRRLYRPFLLAGIACFLLPLVWPRFFFPLVWGAFLFLLEPLNHRYGAPSLLRDWENGSPRRFYLLLLAGAVCGLLWEMWNFKAGSKWIYTVPYVGGMKVFEMPILGFFGFPPFAVECYVMTVSFFLLAGKIRERFPGRNGVPVLALAAIALIVFDLFVFAGIDRFTVWSWGESLFSAKGAAAE